MAHILKSYERRRISPRCRLPEPIYNPKRKEVRPTQKANRNGDLQSSCKKSGSTKQFIMTGKEAQI